MAARAERSGPSGPRIEALARVRVIAELKDPHLLPMQLREDGTGYEPAPFAGRTLSELRTSAAGPPTLTFGLRILLDVLRGLAALHGAKQNGSPLNFVHGEVIPSHIVVGVDGKARLIPLVPAHWAVSPGSLPPEVVGYTAPERLLGDKYDQRVDVFSAGVLLWEAIMGEPLFRDRSPDAIVTRLIGGKVPYPVPSSDAPWAVPLSDVALGALAVEPKARCAHVGALGAQIEKTARGKLASPQELAALVATSMGKGARDSNVESMPTVRGSSPLPSAPHLHTPSSVPAHAHAETLGGATRPSSMSRTRRAEPAPEPVVSGSSGKQEKAALASSPSEPAASSTASSTTPGLSPSSSSMPVAPKTSSSEQPAAKKASSSPVPAAKQATSDAAPDKTSSSMPVASKPSSASMKVANPSSSAGAAAKPSSSSTTAAANASDVALAATMTSGPTLVSVVSPLPTAPKASREPSSPDIDRRSEDSLSVAPVEPAGRPTRPPMSARRQWRIVGSALIVSFAVAGFAAYALLDWNPVSTANETVLVPPPVNTAPQSSPTTSAAAAEAHAPAPSASAATAPARPPAAMQPLRPAPIARPPAAAAPRPAPPPAKPQPARPAPKPGEGQGQGKQTETERFGI